MADFFPVPRNIPSSQRSQLITNVAVGDQIDVEFILGRTARGAQFFMTDPSDTVQFRLNSLLRLRPHNIDASGVEPIVEVWSRDPAYPVYDATGLMVHTTQPDLRISSIEIVGLVLFVGLTIEIIVW